MKRFLFFALLFIALAGCSAESTEPSRKIVILDGDKIIMATAQAQTIADLLAGAGMPLAPEDRIFANGLPVDASSPLEAGIRSLQVRRAAELTLFYDGKKEVIKTPAFTVGEALADSGFQLFASDFLEPPASTPILGALTVEYRAAKLLTITVSGREITVRSSAEMVGQALASAGIPLIGLDTSLPGESEPVPADGRIRLVRVTESVALIQKEIPFKTEFQLTADLELDKQDLLQVGEPGLAITRVRTRYEDGVQVATQTEPEAQVRPPKDRIVGAGTKIVIRTIDTPYGPLEYYRAVRVYATSYSPCRAGPGRCGHGTAGGMKVTRGVIAVTRYWWRYMNNDSVYIPGYGKAVVSDIGAGIPGRYWIDLGFTDEEYESWHTWTMLYFLTPVPATILYVLE